MKQQQRVNDQLGQFHKLRAVPDLDAVMILIGGYGMIAGVAKAKKTLSPKVKSITDQALLMKLL